MKKCTEQDRSALLEYLSVNAPLNLFFIGDIENEGLESGQVTCWMDQDEQGIHAVNMWYAPSKSLLLSSDEEKIDQEFVDDFLNTHEVRTVSGVTSLLNRYSIPSMTVHQDCWFAMLDHANNTVDTSLTRRLGMDDIPGIVRLEQICFPDDPVDEASLKRIFEHSSGRNYGIYADGKLVSSAGSTAECSNLAMAVAVCTDPDYRDHRYASACIARLSNELLKEGKTPCLFYNAPNAAKIYKGLGYRDIGTWTMIKKGSIA